MLSKCFLQELDMPSQAIELIMRQDRELSLPDQEELFHLLCNSRTWTEGLQLLEKSVRDSPCRGIRELVLLLRCAQNVRETYLSSGIPDDIFVETMKCFSRFEREYEESYGTPGFDRTYWVVRQLSMLLFRIGTLEYEIELPGQNIQIHICSDSSLESEDLRQSWQKAQAFFSKHFHRGIRYDLYCESWMLSPLLTPLLNKDSRILRFQKNFSILKIDSNENDYLQWIYKIGRSDLSNVQIIHLPEKTSLQRAVKKHLLNGGKIGSAMGLLNADPFLN